MMISAYNAGKNLRRTFCNCLSERITIEFEKQEEVYIKETVFYKDMKFDRYTQKFSLKSYTFDITM